MAFSVHTNASSLQALQTLNGTNRNLSVTQARINTGLAVASARDDAANFGIAQNLRADLAGLNSVQTSLDRASSTLDVALAASEAVADLLTELRGTAVRAADQGLDDESRRALNDTFLELRDQIDSIVSEASFNGTNAVETGGTSIIAITNADATSTISITAVDLSLTGLSLDSTDVSDQANSAAAILAIDAAISTTNNVLSDLGAGATRLELQADFTQSLSDAIEIGIGNLVDADLAEESANLQALQVQQQLGLQALSIANQAPQAVLSLFN